jgi:hypothetical protein
MVSKESLGCGKRLTGYSTEAFPHFQNIGEFDTFRKTLNLPCVTSYVANEYVSKIERLSYGGRLQIEIQSEMQRWQNSFRELTTLAEESASEHALDVRHS